MTDNQFNQLFDALTELLHGIQRVEQIMKEPESNVPELKNRIKSQSRSSNAAVNELAGEQLRINSRVVELEKASV